MSAASRLQAVKVDNVEALRDALVEALDGGDPLLPMPAGPVASALEQLGAEKLANAKLPEHTALVLRTSGSTGVAKAVALSADALTASAHATHDALGGPGQWLNVLPLHLISGLQTLVRSTLAGTEPVLITGSFDEQTFIERAQSMQHERRYVSLVPAQLAKLIDLVERSTEAAEVLTRFDAVLVGGQHTPVALRQRAHELGVTLRLSYGMTETAGGCVYDGVEIGDTRVRVRDGEVQLATSSLALGYVGEPALTDERFITDNGTRWYRTGDTGQLLGGMLSVTGRRDRVIISGGVNVSLDEVERVVRAQSGWHTAVAIATPDARWGERVCLIRELSDAEAVPFDQVRKAVKAGLGAAAEPVWANEMQSMPMLEGGKPDLARITDWVADLRKSFRTLGNS